MNQQSKLQLTVLGAALATTAVFAGTYASMDAPVAAEPSATIVTQEETVVATPPVAYEPPAPAPIAQPLPPAEPAITVTEQRLTEDQRIQVQVMEKLANNPTLSGKVGVETRDQVVNLSGYLMTNGQVMRAARDANSVIGVRYVVNEIRTKIGPVTY
jgi:hypothetical protein